jgi:hypothetical protein
MVINTATGEVVQRVDYDEFSRITASYSTVNCPSVLPVEYTTT